MLMYLWLFCIDSKCDSNSSLLFQSFGTCTRLVEFELKTLFCLNFNTIVFIVYTNWFFTEMRRLYMWLFSQWCVDLLIQVVSMFWYMLCRCFDTSCVDVLIHAVSMFWYMSSARIRTHNFLSPQWQHLSLSNSRLSLCSKPQLMLWLLSHILFGKLKRTLGDSFSFNLLICNFKVLLFWNYSENHLMWLLWVRDKLIKSTVVFGWKKRLPKW